MQIWTKIKSFFKRKPKTPPVPKQPAIVAAGAGVVLEEFKEIKQPQIQIKAFDDEEIKDGKIQNSNPKI